MDKYDINFPLETKEQDLKRLINQLWKLIPMRENNEDWVNHLNVIKGAQKTIETNNYPPIIFEVNDNELIEFLKSLGFDRIILKEKTLPVRQDSTLFSKV